MPVDIGQSKLRTLFGALFFVKSIKAVTTKA